MDYVGCVTSAGGAGRGCATVHRVSYGKVDV